MIIILDNRSFELNDEEVQIIKRINNYEIKRIIKYFKCRNLYKII